MYGKGARVLIEVNAGDSGNHLCLLNVGAMAADGQTHQFMRHAELFVVRRPRM